MNLSSLTAALGYRCRMLARRVLPLKARLGRRIIVFHHGVTAGEPIGHNSRFVSAARLERELAGLLEVPGVRFMSLPDLLESEPDPQEARFALTFDDGYRGILLHALPVLERLGIPATLFVTAVHALGDDRQPMLPADRVDLAALHRPESFEISGSAFQLDVNREWRRTADNRPLKQILRECDGGFVRALAAALPIERSLPAEANDYWRLLTPADIASLGEHPLVTIGSHGTTHTSIDVLDPKEARHELEVSRNWLCETSRQAVDLFAYPHGTWSRAAAELAASVGYRWQMVEGSVAESTAVEHLVARRVGNNCYVSSRTQVACFLAGGYDGKAITI